jgi:hypothetical protein
MVNDGGEVEMEVMVVVPTCLWVPMIIFLSYKCIKCNTTNYFYETTKNEKMNDGIFIFFCLHSKYFLWGLYAP